MQENKKQTCDKTVCPSGFKGKARATSVDSTSTPDLACEINRKQNK